jgi:5-methylcytosine-specific restriction endonuclease McrA
MKIHPLYSNIRKAVYEAWSKPILARDYHACRACGSRDDICVHHANKIDQFEDILADAVDEYEDYDPDAESAARVEGQITNWVVNYHVSNKVLGITLCWPCHLKVHESMTEFADIECLAESLALRANEGNT